MEKFTRWKIWLICLIPFLAAVIIMLAGQTALVNSAFQAGAAIRGPEDIHQLLLRTEIPILLILALAIPIIQTLFALSVMRKTEGGEAKSNSGNPAAGKSPKNLYDQALEMYRSAITDEQTGAIIYKHFKTMLESEFTRSLRYKMVFSLVKISIENKENFNSVFHKVAFSITNILRNVDVTSVDVDRKFVILLPNTKKTNAETAVRRIWARVKSVQEQTDAKINLVAGIVTFKEDGDTVELLLAALDRNLEKARLLGAHTIIF